MQQYSLLERFHGALLGPAIAAHYFSQTTTRQTDIQKCLQWLCNPTQSSPPSLSGDTLIDCLTLLPLWLYSHESWRQRQAYLQQIPSWQQSSTDRASLWLHGETIAQVIRPDCQPQHLVSNLLQRWQQHAQQGAPACSDTWKSQLKQQLSHSVELHTIATNEHLLGQCIQTFLDTPQDLTIALHRITQIKSPHTPLMAQLSAALIGTYQGWSRFSTHAITELTRSKFIPATSIEEPHTFSSADSILPYTAASHRLLETWSGMTLSQCAKTIGHTTPNVLTPR